MQRLTVLLKDSDGARGARGKKKVYEVRIDGTTVTFAWGMAEKTSRQRKVQHFMTEQRALSVANEQVWAKQARGYRVAYTV